MIEKYISYAFMYGGIRKLLYTYNTQYKQKDEVRPILYSHHLIHFVFGGTMGIGLAPMYLLNDMERIEMYVRNIKPFSNAYSKEDDKDFFTVLWDHHRSQRR